MFGLPRRASILWYLVTGAGAVLLLGCALTATRDLRLASVAVLFAIAGAIAEKFLVPAQTSRPGHKTEMSV